MTISIKSKKDIQKMRIAGRLAANILEMIEQYMYPGISTEELDQICHQYMKNQKSTSACLGYHGFPKSICTSINDVVCHGIPSNTNILKTGDIINVDISIIKNGFYADTSKMFIIGKTTKIAKTLCEVTQKSLYLAIKKIKPGIPLRTIGKTIQKCIEKHKFSIVREYCGHGIGKNLHEEPQILHYNSEDYGIKLKKGMAFTIEPMINAGKHSIIIMEDNWTVKTKDHSLSAQYEHTVVVTNDGCEILTLRKEESIF